MAGLTVWIAHHAPGHPGRIRKGDVRYTGTACLICCRAFARRRSVHVRKLATAFAATPGALGWSHSRRTSGSVSRLPLLLTTEGTAHVHANALDATCKVTGPLGELPAILSSRAIPPRPVLTHRHRGCVAVLHRRRAHLSTISTPFTVCSGTAKDFP